MSGTLRNAEAPLKTAIVRRLNADLDANNITGVSMIPIVTQDRPLQGFPEPYIYVRVESSFEIDKNKTQSGRKFFVIADVLVRSDASDAATQTRDDIVDEIERIFSVVNSSDYVVVPEYRNYVQEVEDINITTDESSGATYHRGLVTLSFRLLFEGAPMPEQTPNFLFRDFTFSPHGRTIELHDAGIITPETTYPDSNGFTFTSAVFTLTSGADGTFDGTDYTVSATDDNLSLDSVLAYTMGTNTVDLSATNAFNRVRSLRYGASTNDTWTDDTAAVTGLQLLSNFQSAKQTIAFNNLSPIGDQIVFTGAEAGDRLYIMYDATLPALTTLENVLQPGGNDLHLFSSQILGGFRIYTQITPLFFDGALTYNIR